MEERAGLSATLSPALNTILLLVVALGIGIYTQEHLNRVWDRAAPAVAPPSPLPPAPTPSM